MSSQKWKEELSPHQLSMVDNYKKEWDDEVADAYLERRLDRLKNAGFLIENIDNLLERPVPPEVSCLMGCGNNKHEWRDDSRTGKPFIKEFVCPDWLVLGRRSTCTKCDYITWFYVKLEDVEVWGE